ncbi:MAG: radical SAM protein [Candidatus Nitrosopelagicus sp.]|nr:radical SAM protein [Candidatus Nitrosopelagicus sp.]
MLTVSSSQYNYQYGDRIHLPYSIACLVTYLKNNQKIKENFKFEKTFVFRENIKDDINRCKNSDVLLCSCYVWNWELTIHLAEQVKKINPDCLIILGGPHVPENSAGFFDKYPFVDMLVHGEGEKISEEIFTEYLNNKDFSNVKGISTKEFQTMFAERINDLDILPSPYLTNTIWELVENVEGIRWICSWETHRGCPYLCTFCDWGSATFTKMRRFSEETLMKELDWFAENKMTYIDCCDANFGIFFVRDLRIAKKLNELATTKGFPQTFQQSWAKNSSEKIIPIAKELQEGGLLTAVTLSVQSLDENTLTIIKRANMKFDRFSNLSNQFREEGLPTYSEVIRGLPGETLESFKEGLEQLVGESKIDTIYIFHCIVLPNAPMNIPEYREKYKLKTIRSPIYLGHSSINNRTIEEYENVVTSTSTATQEDIKQMYLYSWITLSMHSFGILEYVSRYYNKIHGMSYMKFYEEVLEFCKTENSIFSEEYEKVVKHSEIGYKGEGWNHYDPKLGDINWPIEEATWLRLASQKSRTLDGINLFLEYLETKLGYATPKEILRDLAKFQLFLISTKENQNVTKSETFEYDWKEFFASSSQLRKIEKNYNYKNQIVEKDDFEWNKKAIWYGRRGKTCKFDSNKLSETPINFEIIRN